MDILLKASAGVLIALVLSQLLNKSDKNISTLLIIVVCCMIIGAASQYVHHLFTFLHKLEVIGNLNSEVVKIMFKAVGIGLLTEVVSLICTDAGNSVLARSIQLLSSVIILWICIPVFTELITLAENILGGT